MHYTFHFRKSDLHNENVLTTTLYVRFLFEVSLKGADLEILEAQLVSLLFQNNEIISETRKNIYWKSITIWKVFQVKNGNYNWLRKFSFVCSGQRHATAKNRNRNFKILMINSARVRGTHPSVSWLATDYKKHHKRFLQHIWFISGDTHTYQPKQKEIWDLRTSFFPFKRM